VVRGPPQLERGGRGAGRYCPFCIYPNSNPSPDVTRNFEDGTHNLPNGTQICQKGPVFPRWDPIWAEGTHVCGARISASA
jgi:hypothetical protein